MAADAVRRMGGRGVSDLLPLEAAAEIVGVPAVQLKLWAWDRVGPRNVGTRTKPLYDQRDLEEWKADAKRRTEWPS